MRGNLQQLTTHRHQEFRRQRRALREHIVTLNICPSHAHRLGMQCGVQGLRELAAPRRQIRHRNAQPRLRVLRQDIARPARGRLALSLRIHAFASLDIRARGRMGKIHPK